MCGWILDCACCVGCCVCNLVWKIISAFIIVIVIIAIILLAVFLTRDNSDADKRFGRYGLYAFKQAAVSANGQECAEIGKSILLKNGSAADAAIATLFCDGIACSQCMGLGGGFFLTIYTRATGKVEILNAREVAPLRSSENMFKNGTISSKVGGLAVAVPGELRGYKKLYERYGKLPWADLIKPSIDLCHTGYITTAYLARVLKDKKDVILNEPSLREIYINPQTNDVWQEGDLIKKPQLAKTLTVIAKEGPDALHNGSLTKDFIKDVQYYNGILTEEDMRNYEAQWLDPLKINIDDEHQLYTVPLPGSGHILSFIINALRGWVFPENIGGKKVDVEENSVTYWHRIVEVFKYAYAKRTSLGDPKFLPEDKLEPLLKNLTSIDYAHYIRSLISDDKTYNNWTHYGADFGLTEDHGTAQISVLAANGDAVSVTSTINFIFGALRRSMSTGIILNNEMDDFSFPYVTNIYDVPPSPSNFVKPGKTPLSSMVPSIVVQKGRGARFVVGAAGGTKITTQVALAVMKHLFSNEPLSEVIDHPRLHHQLFPMAIQSEVDFDKDILQGLKNIGHNITMPPPTAGFAAITGVSVNRTSGTIDAQFDRRRTGSIAGF